MTTPWWTRHRFWIGLLLLVAAGFAVFYAWGDGDTAASAGVVGNKVRSAPKGTTPLVEEKVEETALATRRKGETVKVPLEFLHSIYCPAFDEEKGELLPAFMEVLRLSGDERKRMRPLLAPHLEAFGKIELENSEVLRGPGIPVIRLKPCVEAYAALNAEFAGQLTEVLGPSRAQAAAILVGKQLRERGEYWVDLSMEERPGVGWIFDRKIGDRPGESASHISLPVAVPEFSQHLRWRHLDQVDLRDER